MINLFFQNQFQSAKLCPSWSGSKLFGKVIGKWQKSWLAGQELTMFENGKWNMYMYVGPQKMIKNPLSMPYIPGQ